MITYQYSYFLNSVRREECVPTWHDNPVRLLNVDTCPGQNFTNSGYHRQNHSGDIVRIGFKFKYSLKVA